MHIINYWSFYQPVLGSLYNTLTTGSGAGGGAGGGGGPRPSMGIWESCCGFSEGTD